ncbi:MAG: hypothetical protein MJZ17_05925 [Bacteroidales bacterium]|nr:hypothetical protein [Bacteroidales bacterium]
MANPSEKIIFGPANFNLIINMHEQMENIEYRSPRVKVVEVQQKQIICASEIGSNTEKLEEDAFEW